MFIKIFFFFGKGQPHGVSEQPRGVTEQLAAGPGAAALAERALRAAPQVAAF